MKSATLLAMLVLMLNCPASGQDLEIDFYATSETIDSLDRTMKSQYKVIPNKRVTYKNKLLSFDTDKGIEKVKILRVLKFEAFGSKVYALEAMDKSGMYKYYKLIVTRVSNDLDINYFIVPNIVQGLHVSETTYMN